MRQLGRPAIRFCLVGAALATLTATPSPERAERLPIKTYTTADGLAHDTVRRIVADSPGFLWFCTAQGLSRFDGQNFFTYDASFSSSAFRTWRPTWVVIRRLRSA